MRKIEKMMIQAINSGKDFELDNTRVEYDAKDNVTTVYLYGHRIARRFINQWYINLCGYNTVTTRSRLTAILSNYSSYVYGVATRKGQAVIVRATNEQPINDNEWIAV